MAVGSRKGKGTRGRLKREAIFSLICSLTFESEIAVVAVQLIVSDSDFSSFGGASEVTLTGHTLRREKRKPVIVQFKNICWHFQGGKKEEKENNSHSMQLLSS